MAGYTKKGNNHCIIFTSSKRTPRQKYLYFNCDKHSKSDVLYILCVLEVKYKKGEFDPWIDSVDIREEMPGNKTTIKKAVEKYIQHLRNDDIKADSTIDKLSNRLKHFNRSVGTNKVLAELTNEDFNEFINGGNNRYNTRKKRMSDLSLFSQYLNDQGYIESIPELTVKSSRAERADARNKHYKDFLKPDEVKLVIDKLDVVDEEKNNSHANSVNAQRGRRLRPKLKNIYWFVYYTGFRLNDIVHFMLDWIDDDGKYIHIGDEDYRPKSQKRFDTIPIMPEVENIIEEWQSEYEKGCRIFSDMNNDFIGDIFKECCLKAFNKSKADRISFQNLKDSATMYYLFFREKTLKPQHVQQVVRHADISTTMEYVHAAPESVYEELRE